MEAAVADVRRVEGVSVPRFAGRVAVVTGGTSRLGSSTAKGMARSGQYDTLVIVGRNARKGLQVVSELQEMGVHAEFLQADLASLEEVRHLSSKLRGTNLRCLACMAGATALELRQETTDGFEYHFGVNFLSRFLLVNSLLEELTSSGNDHDPAKVLLVSNDRHWGAPFLGFSAMGASLPLALGDFEDLQLRDAGAYSPAKAFGQAALCNVLFAYELQRRLRDRAVRSLAVSCVDPGPMSSAWHVYCKEENRLLAGGMPDWLKEPLRYFARLVEEPEVASATAITLATTKAGALVARSPQLGSCGYWERGVPVPSKCPLPWSPGSSYDEAAWAKLWAHAEQLIVARASAHHSGVGVTPSPRQADFAAPAVDLEVLQPVALG